MPHVVETLCHGRISFLGSLGHSPLHPSIVGELRRILSLRLDGDGLDGRVLVESEAPEIFNRPWEKNLVVLWPGNEVRNAGIGREELAREILAREVTLPCANEGRDVVAGKSVLGVRGGK